MRAGWQHVLGLCEKGTCLQVLPCTAGVLSAGSQVGTCRSRNGKNVLGKGPAEHSPSPQERKMLPSQVEEGRTEGLMLFSGDTVSYCSREGGRKEGQQLRATAGWFGVAVSLSPSGAGGCPREEAVHVQETQQQDLAALGLAQSQQCSGPRPLLETI